MFSILKKLFSKAPEPEASKPSFTPPATAATATKSGVPSAATPAAAPPSDGIPITLKTVVASMPDTLKKRLDKELTGAEVFHISRAEAMRQLPTGAVKISFAEIHRLVPNTFLTPDQEMLEMQISLPLQEILPRIKSLPRRASQKVVEVPDDVEGMFGPKGEAKKKAAVAPLPTGAATSPEPTIPKPAAPTVPKPQAPVASRPAAAAPVAAPTPAAATAPAPAKKEEEKYVPPAPKALEPQAPITFKLESPAPTPVSTPASAAIPNVPKPSPPGTPATSLTPKPAFTPPPPAPVAAPAAADQPSISLGDVFGQPDKKDWTPQEVVQKVAALRGVAGAIITTADGLPVAFQLPEHLNGNVIGAFVPQMYTRIAQYTRDLKLGDAKHLTILVENTPLQMFKTGNVYFTALGKAGENLPKPQLTAIAGALGRQS